MKLSMRWYLTYYSKGLHRYCHILKKMYDSNICQFDCRLVNQQRQIYHRVFRLFDSLIALWSNISPCQKTTTLILIPPYKPSFHLKKPSKKPLGTAVFLSWMHFKVYDCDKLLSTTSVMQFWLQSLTKANKPTFYSC